MKNKGLLLCAALFACSDNGLDLGITEPKTTTQPCYVAEPTEGSGKCYEVTEAICTSIGGELGSSFCFPSSSSALEAPSSSSSSLGSSSSSSSSAPDAPSSSSSSLDIAGSSSSSAPETSSSSSSSLDIAGSSSSSVPETSSSSSNGVPGPSPSGSFEFRNFDYSSSSKIYFLNRSMHVSSTPTGTSQLYNSLSITNSEAALCGQISIEITGGGLTSIAGEPNQTRTAAIGTITAKAVATCNGAKVELATATATVVDDPILTACPTPTLPFNYVAKTKQEPVSGLISLDHNYGRCGNVAYALGSSSSTDFLNFAAYSGQQNLNVTASVSCASGVTVTSRSCPISVFVADRHIEGFIECNETPHFSLSTGTTIFEYRCQTSKNDYYIKCTPDQTAFKLDAEGFTTRNSDWGGANLPGNPEPLGKGDGFFYYPKRILATVTVASNSVGPATGCRSW